MPKYPCPVIEDLLPLYLEDDVSPESRAIIEEHIRECERCRALVKEYAVGGPGQALPATLKEWPERIPNPDSFKRLMKRLKRMGAAGLAVIIVLGLVISGVSYNAGKKTNNEHLLYAKNMDDVQAYLYEKTPGLKRAESEGNVANLDQTSVIPEGKGSLTLDKIWYSGDKIYLFYHLDGQIPTDAFGSLKWENDEHSTNFADNMNMGEGIVYKGVYYSRLTFGNVKEARRPSEQKLSENLELALTLRYGDLRKNESQIKLTPMNLVVTYDPAREQSYRVSLNGKVSLGGYGDMILKELEVKPQESSLSFDYQSPDGSQFYYLAGTLTTDKGEDRKLWIPSEPTGKDTPFYRIKFDALEQIPENISLKIDGMMLITPTQVKFEVPVAKLHGQLQNPMKEEKLHRPIGKIEETEIFLDRLVWDDRGLDFEVVQAVKGYGNNPIDRTSTGMIYSVWEQRHNREREDFKNWRLPNVVTVTDEQGREAGQDQYGQRGSGPGPSIGMFIGKEFIESAENINITISNVTQRVTGPWSGEAAGQ